MNVSEINWKVAGFAGEGIMTTGLLFSKTCVRHGWHIFDYTEYPSLIRGGHNTYQVIASNEQVSTQRKLIDVLVALNKNALVFHKDELSDNSIVIYDQEDDNVDINQYNLPGRSFNLPMVRLAEESGAKRVMSNNVAMGASIFFLGLDINVLQEVIADIFGRKGQEVVDLNINAAKAGYEYAKQNSKPLFTVEKVENKNLVTATGNEAAGLGAIAGGLQYYVAYPMTPSSSVLHFLASVAKKADFVVKHAEDEIGTVNMALGASFAGVRTMVGTSGGGFCYMTEALGLAGVAELPLVVFEAMRPGPALGMPTWTAQGDLLFAINASQDEFPRIVLVPGDGQEMFELVKKSLELAEKYQTLVIVLSDKHLSESRYTLEIKENVFSNQRYGFAQNPQTDETGFFPRYKPAENGLSERSLPGQTGGLYIANSYEHDQYGFGSEDPHVRVSQVNKRFNKFEAMRTEIPPQYYLENQNSKLTLISFGSTKGAAQRAVKLLKQQNIPVDLLNLSWLWPFPSQQVEKALAKTGRSLVIEGNSQKQLSKLITQETGIKINDHLLRFDGRPFFAEDIVEHIKKLA